MRFDGIYQDYLVVRSLLNNVTNRSGQPGGEGFLATIDFPDAALLPNDPKLRRTEVASKVGKTVERLTDATFLALAAEFEHVVFHKLRRAGVKAAEVLGASYPADAPLHDFRQGLARNTNDFGNLGGLRALFDTGTLDSSDRSRLYGFFQERNFIAHGRRPDWNEAQSFAAFPDVEAAYRLFKRIAASL